MEELNYQIYSEWLNVFSKAIIVLDDNLIMDSLLDEAKQIIDKQ